MKILPTRLTFVIRFGELLRYQSSILYAPKLLKHPKRLDRILLRSACTVPERSTSVTTEEGGDAHCKVGREAECDDSNYFKRLSKTINPYWIANAEAVCQRLDWKRLLDPERRKSLEEDFRRRYAEVNVEKICKLWNERERCKDKKLRESLTEELLQEALWVPNDTHPEALSINDEIPKEIFRFGNPNVGEGIQEFSKFCNKFGFLRDDQLGHFAYHKSYYLKGPLVELEDGLVRYSLHSLASRNFQIIAVPDIIYPHIIESCGMKTRGERDQVFWLQSDSAEDICLSGTAEMSIAGSFQDKIFEEEQLPLKFTAVSRCFRAETSGLEEERGLYRVHEFTKVEMFGVTADETGEESNQLHQEFRQIEEQNFSALNIHFKTLEMPPSELGASAFRKFDIEAWMPGRKMYGEISSCSNCTDFQSRRLNIRYRPKKGDGSLKYVHTVNGTACAIPRLLITLVETFQKPDGVVQLPSVLNPFMPRSWENSLKNFRNHKIRFLRNKSQQDKYVHNAT